jgi:hypothetical protein
MQSACPCPSPRLPAMFSLLRLITSLALAFVLFGPAVVHAWTRCRSQPGDPGYPTDADWSALNDTIGGRLLNVVPSAKACHTSGCTEAQWKSGIFRQTIPGSMNSVGILTRSPILLMTVCTHVVQLGTGEYSQAVLSFPSAQVHPGDRITAVHPNSAYITEPSVLKEMSLFMQSMQQKFNIFRFTLLFSRYMTIAYPFLGWNQICPGPRPARCYQILRP